VALACISHHLWPRPTVCRQGAPVPACRRCSSRRRDEDIAPDLGEKSRLERFAALPECCYGLSGHGLPMLFGVAPRLNPHFYFLGGFHVFTKAHSRRKHGNRPQGGMEWDGPSRFGWQLASGGGAVPKEGGGPEEVAERPSQAAQRKRHAVCVLLKPERARAEQRGAAWEAAGCVAIRREARVGSGGGQCRSSKISRGLQPRAPRDYGETQILNGKRVAFCQKNAYIFLTIYFS